MMREGITVIDDEGYRSNVGIIVINGEMNVLWARRKKQNAWQFPQGGIHPGETPEQALYRELQEELGLTAEDVQMLGCTKGWLYYRLPEQFLRHHLQPLCIGQKQKWYMLKLLSPDSKICLSNTDTPEFDRWRWVHYWYPLKQVIAFKRHVYRRALEELSTLIPGVLRQNRMHKDKEPQTEKAVMEEENI